MKKTSLFAAAALVLWSGFATAGTPPRRCVVGKTARRLTPEQLEIVVAPNAAPAAKFAADELGGFLKRRFGRTVARTTAPTPGKFALVVGDHPLGRAAGIAPEQLPTDGFVIKSAGSAVIIAGRDDPRISPVCDVTGGNWLKRYAERGSLYAVYDFLERFAGVRLYFPGEIGEVVPRGDILPLPEIDLFDRPDMPYRRYYCPNEAVWHEQLPKVEQFKRRTLHQIRQRFGSWHLPFCHGLNAMQLVRRFGNSHPEYFAMHKDGIRRHRPDMQFPGQLCYSSPVASVIRDDLLAYFKGAASASRGITYWEPSYLYRNFANVQPQDSFMRCECARCAARWGRGADYATEFMWGLFTDWAKAVKKVNPRARVVAMSYRPYGGIPQVEIPDNLDVFVATTGPWMRNSTVRQAEHKKHIVGWNRKIGRPVILWNYVGKYGQLTLPGIPAVTPRAIGAYYRELAPFINGVFFESETDQEIFVYQNSYVAGRVMWDPQTDVNALLAEHDRAMFGAGAQPMRRFFDRLEHLWLDRVYLPPQMTALGATVSAPPEQVVWSQIYSPAELKNLHAMLTAAEKAAAKDAESLRRIRFFRREFIAPIEQAAARFRATQEALDSWKFHAPEASGKLVFTIDGRADEPEWKNAAAVWLLPFRGERNEVRTQVRLRHDRENIYLFFDCGEPRWNELKIKPFEHDNGLMCKQPCVEILLDPTGTRKMYYHLMLTAGNSCYDAKNVVANLRLPPKTDRAWESGVEFKSVPTATGWAVEARIPKSRLGRFNAAGGFPVNFGRNRGLDDKPEELSQWSPFAGRSFHEVDKFGLWLTAPDTNVVRNGHLVGEFSASKTFPLLPGVWQMNARLWKSGSSLPGRGVNCAKDRVFFMLGGESLRLTGVAGGYTHAIQRLPGLKPNRRYRLSYWVRTENVRRDGSYCSGAGAYLVHDAATTVPTRLLSGDCPWHRQVFDFTSGPGTNAGSGRPASIGLWLWNATGQVWFDGVRIEEL